MTRNKLRYPDDVREFLSRRFSRQHRNWLSGQGQWPIVVSLGSPTEHDVTENPSDIRAWISAWHNWKGIGEVHWEARQWPRLGPQRIPLRFSLTSPEQVAEAVGEQQRWAFSSERYDRLTHRWPVFANSSVLPRYFDVLADYDAPNFERLYSLLLWLDNNPQSNLYLRQLPVEGLDTKWVEQRKSLVSDLVQAMRGQSLESDLLVLCGLLRPKRRVRVRVLCPNLRKAVGGVEDLEAPLEEVAALPVTPDSIIIVENLETGLALGDTPGAIAFMKLGNAVNILASIPWVQNTDAVYWGDVDTHGYVILDRARRILPGLKSVLMDKETLLTHRNLWGEEFPQNCGVELPSLLGHEIEVYEGLCRQTWGRSIRLEQERIPWASAVQALGKALGGPSASMNC